MENHFVRDTQAYTRNLNIVGTYQDDAARFLSIQTGKPYEQCLDWVRTQTSPGGSMAGTDPEVLCLSKEQPGTRSVIPMTFMQYLQDIEQRKAIYSPTLCVYLNPNEKRSLLADYIETNINLRKKTKKQMFVDKMAGNKQAAADGKILQSTYKIKNNSLSGAHASPYTILYNKSSHSSLTSTCRCATGYANANNERFLFGNRHYFDVEIALQNIISIVNHSDYDAITFAMEKYNLHYPSVEDVCEAIQYSTDLYWHNQVWTDRIYQLVSKLSDIQRAAYLYTADMYHLRKHNNDFMYAFLDALSTKATEPDDDADTIIALMDADLEAYIGILCAKELAGKTISDAKERDPRDYGIIAATARRIIATLDEYKELIKAFWVTDNPPSTVAYFTDSIRRGVLVSDTDSTIFTVQDWTQWFTGKISFTDKDNALAAAIVYVASQTTIHLLAQFSANMGVVPEKLHMLAMKNEFMFPTLLLTSRAKHYASYISAQEGNVYDKLDTEIKGVVLKSTKAPQHVIDKLHQFILSPMDTIMAGNKISIKELLDEVASLEREILDSLERGEVEYLTTMNIKTKASYANPTSSNYIYYGMWEEVWAPKYGPPPPPPYRAVKVSLTTGNGSRLKEWYESMEDQELAQRLKDWLTKNRRLGGLKQVLVPMEVALDKGIPKEIIDISDKRKVVFTTMEAFYLILESYGVFLRDQHITKLVSDFH